VPQYRVTFEGLKCTRSTWDHALNVDGWRDEIFVDVQSQAVQSPDLKFPPNWNRSKIMGDTSAGGNRERAGSGTNGGISDGDYVYHTLSHGLEKPI
jgi:hypothetical protein